MTSAQATDRELQLLAAAGACFARRGFRGTTVADIAAEAGCSQGLLYRYFAGKDALISALIASDAQRYVEWLVAMQSQAEPVAALRELLGVVLADIEEPGAAALQMEILAEAGRAGSLAEVVRHATAEVLSALAQVVRGGQSSGALAGHLDPDVTARTLVALVDGLTAQRAFDPTFSPRAHAPAIGALLENLLIAHPDGGS